MSATGGCLCGAVRYTVRGALRHVVGCHCSQCRRWTGNFVTATRALTAELEIADSGTLTWYRSSGEAERGFCGRCGSSLFWRASAEEGTHTVIMAGSLDPPTGLKLQRHIFVADKSDFYDIADDLPQHAGYPD